MTPPTDPSPLPYPQQPPQRPVPGVDHTDTDVPTLEHVRDRIEGRQATAEGAAELARESAEGQARQQVEDARERAAAAALARIRASIRPADGRP